MSSQTQHDHGPTSGTNPTPPAATATTTPSGPDGPHPPRGEDHRRRWPVVALAVALVLALAGATYLGFLSRAWADRADEVDAVARELGADLAETRAELGETQDTLALVESQLDGAQQQIHELADTAAQFGDDREIQRQVAEYQAELFTAATGVTGTMGQCISAQTEYTLALEGELVRAQGMLRAAGEEPTESPSPDATQEPLPDLPAMRQTVVDTCQQASDAHEGLRQRLGDS